MKLLPILRKPKEEPVLAPPPPEPAPPVVLSPMDAANTRRAKKHANDVFRKFDTVVADYRQQDKVLKAGHR